MTDLMNDPTTGSRNLPMVVFSDLDGTLLDHQTYAFDAALPALAALSARQIPLVLATSKTGAEVAPLRAALGAAHWPALVENGAGLLAPEPSVVSETAGGTGRTARDLCAHPTHPRIRAALDALPNKMRAQFNGFSDWGPAEVARRTGLPLPEAERACARDYSEPGIFEGDAIARAAFIDALAAHGVKAQSGGRFLTLTLGADKAQRMREALALLGFPNRSAVHVLALGDGENDIALLEAADAGVVVANPAHAPLPPLVGEREGRITRTKAIGPAGWNEVVLAALGLAPNQPER